MSDVEKAIRAANEAGRAAAESEVLPCPQCGFGLHAMSSIGGEQVRIEPGSCVVCSGCGTVLELTPEKALRALTQAELQKLPQDMRVQVARAQMFIRNQAKSSAPALEARVVRLEQEISKLWEGLARLAGPPAEGEPLPFVYRGKRLAPDEVRAFMNELIQTLVGVRQAVHQAHHEKGEPAACRQGICADVALVLGDVGGP